MNKIPQRIAIIGLKHSGKSNHGRTLAKHFGLPFYDLDACILALQSQQTSIRSLYSEVGEAGFRRAEVSAFEAILTAGKSADGSVNRYNSKTACVISTGGGSMENEELVCMLREAGFVMLFIDLLEEVLFKRIEKKGLPPFLQTANPAASFHEIYTRRRSLALKQADIHIRLGDIPKAEAFERIKKQMLEFQAQF